MENPHDSAFTRRSVLARTGVSLATALMAPAGLGPAEPAKASEVSSFGGHIHALAVSLDTKELTPKGVAIAETSDDADMVKVIHAHAEEITGFVEDGMSAMMRDMMR